MAEQWHVRGTYFEACNCEIACPCNCTNAPTDGECKVVVAWHIDEGQYGSVDLAGLNTALFAYASGHMLEAKWEVALYTDERASHKQAEAVVPDVPLVVSKSSRYRYNEYGHSVDISDRNGYYSPFAYQS